MNLKNEIEGKFTPLIVKVRRAGYVPDGMTVRMRIDAVMFTADCESIEMLKAARADPLVESVSVSGAP